MESRCQYDNKQIHTFAGGIALNKEVIYEIYNRSVPCTEYLLLWRDEKASLFSKLSDMRVVCQITLALAHF